MAEEDVPMTPLWACLCHYWRFDDRLTKATWRAIERAQWSEAVSFRQVIVLLDDRRPSFDLVQQFVRDHLPPMRAMSLVENLLHEGLLTRSEARQVEALVLARVNRDGEWM
jgi:hypothetical protein